MKKKFVLAISTILLSIGLLVGCSGDEEIQDDQMQNENPEQGEVEFDPAVNEDDMNEGTDGEMNEGTDGEMNEGTDGELNGGTDGEMNEGTDGEILNEEPDEKEQP